jgi:hypothetical protein
MKADSANADSAEAQHRAGASSRGAARESDLTFFPIRSALAFAGWGVRA